MLLILNTNVLTITSLFFVLQHIGNIVFKMRQIKNWISLSVTEIKAHATYFPNVPPVYDKFMQYDMPQSLGYSNQQQLKQQLNNSLRQQSLGGLIRLYWPDLHSALYRCSI